MKPNPFSSDKVEVLKAIQSLPSPSLDPRLARATLAGSTPSNGQELETNIAELDAILRGTEVLKQLTCDAAADKSIQAWYGQQVLEGVLAKGHVVDLAEAFKDQDEVDLVQLRHRQEERNSEANDLVMTGLTILKLREQSITTQVVGYQLEEDKQQHQLDARMRAADGNHDHSFWVAVDAIYQRIMPGLTVTEVTYMNRFLA